MDYTSAGSLPLGLVRCSQWGESAEAQWDRERLGGAEGGCRSCEPPPACLPLVLGEGTGLNVLAPKHCPASKEARV